MKINESVREVEKKYSSLALWLAIGVGLVMIIMDMKPLARGLILGTVFSVLNFILMAESLPARLAASGRRAGLRSGIMMMGRLAVLAIPLIVAVKLDKFNLATTIIGLFMIQLLLILRYAGRMFK